MTPATTTTRGGKHRALLTPKGKPWTEAAVIGRPDPSLGEEVVAVVALKPGASADADEIRAWCKERLAAYKYPRRVVLVDALPKGPTGKILKREISV